MVFEQRGRENADGMAPYEILLPMRYTVGEFVNGVATRPYWGEIRVDTMPFWYGGTSLGWYRNDELGAEYDGDKLCGEFDHSCDNKIVWSARMVGGHSRYDFNLCIGK